MTFLEKAVCFIKHPVQVIKLWRKGMYLCKHSDIAWGRGFVIRYGKEIYVGDIPARKTIEIPSKEVVDRMTKPQDDCHLLGWKCYEVIGAPVYKIAVAIERMNAQTKEDAQQHKNPFKDADELKSIDAMKVGDEIAVPTMFGWGRATVQCIDVKEKQGRATSEKYLYPLEFARDERGCWTCGGSINMAATMKGTFKI